MERTPVDPDLDSDLIQCMLASGTRTPQNEFERELLKEIMEARAHNLHGPPVTPSGD